MEQKEILANLASAIIEGDDEKAKKNAQEALKARSIL
jgi:hypothetical protein